MSPTVFSILGLLLPSNVSVFSPCQNIENKRSSFSSPFISTPILRFVSLCRNLAGILSSLCRREVSTVKRPNFSEASSAELYC